MSDERERRFRARIDLSVGRATVSELHPVDRRTAATMPPVQRPPAERAEPPHPGTPPEITAAQDAAVSVPSASPIFPWMRTPEATLPYPQDAARRGQPLYGAPPPAEPDFDAAAVNSADPASMQAPAPAGIPWAEQHADPGTVAMPIYMDEAIVDRIAETVVMKLRASFGIAPDEPPVPLLEAAGEQILETAFEMNPAGSFVDEVEHEPSFDPAGSFVHEP